MPCSDYNYMDEEDRKAAKAQVSRLTGLLCGLCGDLERAGHSRFINSKPSLSQWWVDHKKLDEERGSRSH